MNLPYKNKLLPVFSSLNQPIVLEEGACQVQPKANSKPWNTDGGRGEGKGTNSPILQLSYDMNWHILKWFNPVIPNGW